MLIPVRCFTCGKVVAHLWEEYETEKNKLQFEESEKSEDGKKRFKDIEELSYKTKEGELLDRLGIQRYCCRRMFLCNVDLTQKI